MFERFTGSARQVLVLAQQEARMLNHSYIGTEHLLLGLLNYEEQSTAPVESRLGVSLEHARAQVERIVGRGPRPPGGHIPFTPRAKNVFEWAFQQAHQAGDRWIDPAHLMLGVIDEDEGVARRVLDDLNVDLAAARTRLAAAGPPGTGPAHDTDSGQSEPGSATMLSRTGNWAVVQLPGRTFPGLHLPGDTFASLRDQLAQAAHALHADPHTTEALDDIDNAVNEMTAMLEYYESILAQHHLRRPY